MKDVIRNKVTALESEARELVNRREALYKAVGDVDVRLHQIAGAITELNTILKEGEEIEANQSNERTVPESTDETEQSGASAKVREGRIGQSSFR